MTVHDWLERAAKLHPATIAVEDGRDSLTFAELDQRATEVAVRLRGEGVEQGSSAILLLGEGIGKVIQIHALIRLGVTVVPLERDLPAIERTRSSLAVSPDHELGPDDGLTGTSTGEIEPRCPEPSEVLCRILTGGSTGEPKPVSLTRENHFMSALGSAVNLGVQPEDRWLCPVSLSHVSGMAILIRSAIYGTGMVLADRFGPGLLGDSVRDQGVNAVSLVPTMLRRVLEEGREIEGLRFALVGGGPIPRNLVGEAGRAGIPAVPTYGLTEACSQVATSTPEAAVGRPESVGLPLPVTELRIVEREIQVRGPTVSPEATGHDGWLRTGDLGRLDEDGFLYVEGRADRLILSGGEKVQPAEVEAVLEQDPGVVEAVVLGVPDPEWQQAVVAVVVPAEGDSPGADRLRVACEQSLARFKVPKRILFADRIPLTRAGKPDLGALVAMVGERAS